MHIFCETCLKETVKRHPACPICRKSAAPIVSLKTGTQYPEILDVKPPESTPHLDALLLIPEAHATVSAVALIGTALFFAYLIISIIWLIFQKDVIFKALFVANPIVAVSVWLAAGSAWTTYQRRRVPME